MTVRFIVMFYCASEGFKKSVSTSITHTNKLWRNILILHQRKVGRTKEDVSLSFTNTLW